MNVLPFPECLTSIEENEFYNSKLFPNPTTDYITLSSSQTIISITIYNSEGQLVENIRSVNVDQYKIGVDQYSNGLYFVKVTSDNGSYLHRFLKLPFRRQKMGTFSGLVDLVIKNP